MYVPSSDDAVSRTTVFVCALVAMIFAFGTAAPEVSVIVPTSSPLDTCAAIGSVRTQVNRMQDNNLAVDIGVDLGQFYSNPSTVCTVLLITKNRVASMPRHVGGAATDEQRPYHSHQLLRSQVPQPTK